MQHTLAAYMPMDRRQALAGGEMLPDRMQGAVLLADVSGFTPLTIALTQELGPQRGAEELTGHLDRIYGALIEQVHCYRGSVVGFARDAITCWFDQDKGRMATASALAMQGVMADHAALTTPGGTAVPLGIKMAVLAGSAQRFLVGNPQIQVMDVLAGPLLESLAAAGQQLHEGEILLGAEIPGWLGDLVQVKAWRSTHQRENLALVTGLTEPTPADPWPGLPSLDPDAARVWVLPPIWQRLERGEAPLLAELRTAVPVFLGFSGIDYDADAQAGVKLDAFTRWVQTVLAHYGGYLTQLTVGDEGNCMSILFGAPVAHEDDPARAVAAALELRTPPPELSFIRDVQIGISQGQMYVGAYGGPMRCVYAGLGREVDLASRLTSRAAPGQVLVSGRIAKAAAGYTFEALGEIQLPDIPQPVVVFAVSGGQRKRIGHLLHGRAALPMVGREAERAILGEQLRNLENGQSGCCIVDGEAGIGKSWLVDDLREQAQASGIVTLVGAGDAMEPTTAYYAWRPVFRALFGLDEAGLQVDSDALQGQVLAYIESDVDLVERLPLLNVVLPLGLPDNALTAQMTGEVRADNTRDALVRLLQRVQREAAALLLILEDAQWLDSASWALAAAVRQHVGPLLLVLVTRPLVESVPAEYEQLRAAKGTRYLRLEAMPRDDALALVRQRLGARELAPEVAALIYDKAEGHPFFSEELAYALRDGELLDVDERGVCRLSPAAGDVEPLAFPDTIQAAITSRIDRLPPAQQTTLKVASVIGRIFAFRTLRDVHPVETDRAQLADYLEHLEQLDITLLQSPPPDLKYIFKHNITQEVAYNLMLFAQRRDLHRRVALWYERTFAADLASFYPLLAYHWMHAEVNERALDCLEKAGEQALRIFANKGAKAFFRWALALDEQAGFLVDPSRRGRWELRLGEAYHNLSRYIESREHFEKGLRALGFPVPKQRVQQIFQLLRQVLRQVVHRLWPRRYMGRRADRKKLLQEVARAYRRLVEGYAHTGDILLAAHAALSALNCAETAGPCPELAEGYASVGHLMGFIALHRPARAYIQRALDVVQEIENLSARGWAAQYAGAYYVGIGDWGSAETQLNAALEVSDCLEDRRLGEAAKNELAEAARYQGQFKRGLKLAVEAYQSARNRKDFLQQSLAQTAKAACLYSLGELDEAEACVKSVERLYDEQGDLVRLPKQMAHGVLLAVYVQQLLEAYWQGAEYQKAEYPKVQSTARELENLLTGAKEGLHSHMFVYGHLAEAYLILQGPSQYFGAQTSEVRQTSEVSLGSPPLNEKTLKKQARRACNDLKKRARVFRVGRPCALLQWGKYLSRSCEKRAHRSWDRSCKEATKLTMPFAQGLVDHERGLHLLKVGKPKEGKKYIERAIDTLRAIDTFIDRLGMPEDAPALKRAPHAQGLVHYDTAPALRRARYAQGLAHYEIGRHLEERGERKKHLEEAIGIFSKHLGLPETAPALKRARKALKRGQVELGSRELGM